MQQLEELQKLDKLLGDFLDEQKRQKQFQSDKEFLVSTVSKELQDIISPVLKALDSHTEATTQSIKENVSKMVEVASQLQSLVEKTGVENMKLLESIKSVQVNVPEIKVPDITVTVPKIDVPKAEVTVNQKEIKIPAIKVPKPEVTVNVPEIKIPKIEWPKSNLPIEGWVKLQGVDLGSPLPVQLRDAQGKPVVFPSVSYSGGGKSDFLTIKDFTSTAFNNVIVNTTQRSFAELYRLNTSNSSVAYQGWADPGTSQSTSLWRIRRITSDNDDVYIDWADGNSNFDNSWANRQTLTYV